MTERLLMLTDVKGVLDAKGKIIPRLSQARARSLIRNGTAKDGMIPKWKPPPPPLKTA